MYKRIFFLLLLAVFINTTFAQTTFFNEVDYIALDENECLEVVSPSTEDRTGWQVHIYNENGSVIESVDLNITPTTQTNGFDIIIVDVVLLTDPKRGMAIENDVGDLVQFLNYGVGTIDGVNGPAMGVTSENIGVQLTPGLSLQLTGTGTEYPDFILTGGWDLPGLETCGDVNIDQILLSILPVELLYFDAILKEGQVNTQWATASEQNSFYYLVERSVNGGPFEEIHRTEAAGYSEEELHYSFIDRFPPEGQLYYRLTEVDFDGMMMKSDIQTVDNFKNESKTHIFPNPVEDQLQVIVPETMDYLRIEIFDLITGRKHFEERIDQPGYQIPLNISDLAPGQYLVRLRSVNYIYEHRFIKIDTK